MYIDFDSVNKYPECAEFISECEKRFDSYLEGAVEDILSSPCRAITLTGPTCSGKTTAAAKLCASFEKHNFRARLVSIDDFYRSDEEIKRLGIADYECAAAIDTEMFCTFCHDLALLRKTYMPTFDFKSRSRSDLLPYVPSLNDIYIFEGIQASYREITSCLLDFSYKKVFINPQEEINVGAIMLSPVEIRLMRRVVRDYYNRASSVELTLQLWKDVRKNEEDNIFPNITDEYIMINSTIPYELFVLGKKFLALTDSFKSKSQYFGDVLSLREKLLPYRENVFSPEMIPERSLLREFAF